MSGPAYEGFIVEAFSPTLADAIREGVRDAVTSACRAWLEPYAARVSGVMLLPYAGACWVDLVWKSERTQRDGFDETTFALSFGDAFAATIAARTGAPVWSYVYQARYERFVAATRFAPTREPLETVGPVEGGAADDAEERVHAAICARTGWPPFVLGTSGSHFAPAWLVERVTGVSLPLEGAIDVTQLIMAPEPEATPLRGSSYFFPIWMHDEIRAIAAALGWSIDEVLQGAFERAKHRLFDEIAPGAPPSFPFTRPPAGPTRSATARAAIAARAQPGATDKVAGATDKVARHVWFEQIDEVRSFAIAADRSFSFVLQRAYMLARASFLAPSAE